MGVQIMECKQCGNEVDKTRIGEYASGNFCSNVCARRYSQSTTNNEELKQGNCSVCGKEMWIKKRANNKQVKCDDCRKTKKLNNVKKEKYCINCGNEITGKGRKFCSIKCSGKGQKRNKFLIENILSGKYPKYGSSQLRRRLLNEGYKEHICEICGTKEWNGQPVQLILDHMNGNSMDHTWDNLRLVCPNCDAQSPFYCSKNYGNGRQYRLQHYHKNKVMGH